MAIPLGHKANFNIDNTGIDVVTGLPATTGGPNASGNPVKPVDHPAAITAMQRNKTGPYSDNKDQQSTVANADGTFVVAAGSGSEKYAPSDWTQASGEGLDYPGGAKIEPTPSSGQVATGDKPEPEKLVLNVPPATT
jgi:hypothetical protein